MEEREIKQVGKRDIGLDITRIFAFISVVSVHFFLNSGFYNEPVLGIRMYFMTIMRTLLMVCVPLFVILTGYLMCNHTCSIEHENGMKQWVLRASTIVGTYVLATIVIVIFRKLYLHEEVTIGIAVRNILSYNQYSWYVNMYLGLYLFIPFLNIMWKQIGRKGQRTLVIILVLVTALPSLLNVHDFTSIQIFAHPQQYVIYTQITPNWWTPIWPITYYFIGAYIRNNVDVKHLKTGRIILLMCICTGISGVYNIWRSYPNPFVWGVWNDWGGWQNVLDSTVMFLLLNSIKYPEKETKISKMLGFISKVTFGAYLLSWIPDQVLYPILIERVPSVHLRINYAPIIVTLSIIVSLILSLIVFLVLKVLKKCINFNRFSGVK